MKRFIISRTDSIGDVMLTLPVCGVLKKYFPECEIIFLGRSYTKAIADSCDHIDIFLNFDDLEKRTVYEQVVILKELQAEIIIHVFPVKAIASLAKKAKIPLRIGASGRWYHYLFCNKIVPLTRRRSDLHEAQLNLKLLQAVGIHEDFQLAEINTYYGWKPSTNLDSELLYKIDKQRFNLIIHPRSKGSAREWGLTNFSNLLYLLPETDFKVFVTGTAAEGDQLTELFDHHPALINLTGKLSLAAFIAFISNADGLIAASTGPLHIAAASGIVALGIYPPIKPMHPGRWRPIGKYAAALVKENECDRCRKTQSCQCMLDITSKQVFNKLNELRDERNR
jgi:ADP-heptose:LPS heptosyltransferase